MDFSLQQMSTREFAELEMRLGAHVIVRNGRYWRRVRPFFFRPILPMEEYSIHDMDRPRPGPCAYQYAVTDTRDSNSTMDFVVADNVQRYSLETVGCKRRYLINRASRFFVIRPLRNLPELKDHGYRVYLSFHERTGYSYRSDRIRKEVFEEWAETLFRRPKVLLLGGYSKTGLAAVACAYWVGTTLVHATLMCDTDAMRRDVCELMFHRLREIATSEPRIREIFVRPYRGGNSQDEYYLLRGCHVVQKPARLEMPRFLHPVLRWCLPRQYELLVGAKSGTPADRGPFAPFPPSAYISGPPRSN